MRLVFNVRNLSGLTSLLANLNLRFSFIGITETYIHHIIPIFLVIDLSMKIALTRLAESLVSI